MTTIDVDETNEGWLPEDDALAAFDNDNEMGVLNMEGLLSLPNAQWLVPGVIPASGLVAIYGPPSSYKSFVALDLALSISQGISWLGRYKTNRAPILYVAAEGGAGMKRRAHAWMNHRGFYHTLHGVYFRLRPLNIRDEGVIEGLSEWLDHEELWPRLIVIDTLSQCFSGGDENTNDMAQFIDRCRELAQKRHLTILIIHHTNATGSKERGHTAFRGNVDTIFRCDAIRFPNRDIRHLKLTMDKQRDAEEIEPLYLSPHEYINPAGHAESIVVDLIDVIEEKKEPGYSLPKPMSATAMLLALRAAEEGLTWSEWRIACQLDKTSFNTRIRRLTRAGEIFKEDGRYRIMPALEDLAYTDDEEV